MADPQYLLDSNACIYILEGLSDSLRERVEKCKPGEIVTSAIVFAEVMRGVDRADPVALRKTRRLFSAIPVQPFDEAAGEAYSTVPFRRGRFDRLIAAHALSLDLTVVTSNAADFSDIAGLKVADWTK